MKPRHLLAAAALALLAVTAWSITAHPWGWLYALGVHPYPESSSTPWTYQFYSGMFASLAVLGLLGSAAGLWHHVNCCEPGCWRIGKHKVNGTPWCGRHQEGARPEMTENELLTRIHTELAAVRELLAAKTGGTR